MNAPARLASPLSPTTLAPPAARRSIAVSFSTPGTTPLEMTGRTSYCPPAFGALTTCTTTGPRRVSCTWLSYVTPGMSTVRSALDPGAARNAAARQTMTSLRSIDPPAR
jgi:hypothetical protein